MGGGVIRKGIEKIREICTTCITGNDLSGGIPPFGDVSL